MGCPRHPQACHKHHDQEVSDATYADWMTDSLAVLVGAVISSVVAMFVVGLQYTLERRRLSQAQRVERLADFLAGTHAFFVATDLLARASRKEKPRIEDERIAQLTDRANSRFAQMRLLEVPRVLNAATALDRELTHLLHLAVTKQWRREEWQAQWGELERLAKAYQDVVRKELGAPALS